MKGRYSMKHMSTALIVLALVAASALSTHASEAVQLQTRQPTVSDGEYLYEIKDGEVLVNDQLITLIAFTPKSISASYRNKTDEKKKPQYTIKVYNPYGMLIGSKTLGKSMGMISFGNSTYMEPGAVSSERIHLKEYPLDQILENTNLELPDDLLGMKWVVISATNTRKKIEPAESTVPSKAAPSASSDVR